MKRPNLTKSAIALSVALASGSALAQSQSDLTLSDLQALEELANRQGLQSGLGDSMGAPPMPPPSMARLQPNIPVTLKMDESVTADLSQAEVDALDVKRRSLIKYLYEEENLAKLRNLLEATGRQRAYRDAYSSEFPLTPEEIRALRKLRLDVTRAENEPVSGEIESLIRTVKVDIESPAPIELSVSRGFASSIVFYDESGNPWPLASPVIGDQGSFASQIVGEQKHIAVFEITRDFAESNALINLKGLPVPLVVRLSGKDNIVDSRLSLRIPRMGPNSVQGDAVVTPGVENASSEMMEMLNGGRLKSGIEYDLIGVSGSVFYKNGNLYIRSKASLLAPPIAPPLSAEMVSPTGYNVYRIPAVTSLLFAQDGEMIKASVNKRQKIPTEYAPSIFGNQE